MKAILTVILTSISILSFAQTDIIEMRSRNSSLKDYKTFSRVKFGDHVASNFGMDPAKMNFDQSVLIELSMAVLDSVNWISDSVSIMYTSGNCMRPTGPNPLVDSIWQPGTDTVYNHPLFKHNHSLDSVKTVLDRDYIFHMKSDSTKFIGFDNGEENSKSDEIESQKKQKREQDNNSFGWELIFMIVTPIAFVLGMGRLKLINP